MSKKAKAKQSRASQVGVKLTFDEVEFEGKTYKRIVENGASILSEDESEAFYNPAQETNRDLSLSVLQVYLRALMAERAALDKMRRRARTARATGSGDNSATRGAQMDAAIARHAADGANAGEDAGNDDVGGAVKGTQECDNVAKAAAASTADKNARSGDAASTQAHAAKRARIDSSATSSLPQSSRERRSSAAARPVRILEALSATGLRTVRYVRELRTPVCVVANDLSAHAVEAIRRNFAFNGVQQVQPSASVALGFNADGGGHTDAAAAAAAATASVAAAHHGDAVHVMSESTAHGKRFTVVDLDPYGSAVPFIENAVQCTEDGGLLMVTCTDMAVLCGAHADTCFSKYGSVALRGPYCHEFGLRILLHSLAMAAARHSRYIVPLLSCSIDFYCRVFVRIGTSAAIVKGLGASIGSVRQCVGCDSFHVCSSLNVRTRDEAKGKKKRNQTTPTTATTSATSTAVSASESSATSGEATTRRGAAKAAANAAAAAAAAADAAADSTPYSTLYFEHERRELNKRSLLVTPAVPNVPSTCAACGSRWRVGGPLWTGAIHDARFVRALRAELRTSELGTAKRLRAMLAVVAEELSDAPLYYAIDSLSNTLHCEAPPRAPMWSALLRAGYRVSATHASAKGMKTDAPPHVVWDIMRAWCKTHKPKPRSDTSPSTIILSKESATDHDFSIVDGAFPASFSGARFVAPPLENWGPKRAAKRGTGDETQ